MVVKIVFFIMVLYIVTFVALLLWIIYKGKRQNGTKDASCVNKAESMAKSEDNKKYKKFNPKEEGELNISASYYYQMDDYERVLKFLRNSLSLDDINN